MLASAVIRRNRTLLPLAIGMRTFLSLAWFSMFIKATLSSYTKFEWGRDSMAAALFFSGTCWQGWAAWKLHKSKSMQGRASTTVFLYQEVFKARVCVGNIGISMLSTILLDGQLISWATPVKNAIFQAMLVVFDCPRRETMVNLLAVNAVNLVVASLGSSINGTPLHVLLMGGLLYAVVCLGCLKICRLVERAIMNSYQ